jgi:hypothetical protein
LSLLGLSAVLIFTIFTILGSSSLRIFLLNKLPFLELTSLIWIVGVELQ